MKETENLKLKKPDPEDFYNVGDFNGNMDALDADQARQDEAISQAQQQLDAARQALTQAAQRLATAEQAIAGHTTAIQSHAGNATIHVTQAEKDGWNAKAATGPQGPAGPQGPQGPAGATGPQGPAGTPAYAKRSARFVVGTSTAGWTANDCDYLCDGTADEVQINAAIQALPSGGEVIILDGTYNLAAPIVLKKQRVTLIGNGQSTVLKRAFSGSSTQPGLICVSSSYNTIRFLSLDGAKSSYVGAYHSGIYVFSSTKNNTITGNTCSNNGISGIYVYSSNSNTITGNTCNDNYYGIYVSSSSNNTITGNTCSNNLNSGIYLTTSNSNTITGNTCNDNYYGIYVYSSNSNNTITGNTCNNNDLSSIYLASSNKNNTITGNTCNNYGKYGIYVSSSSNNTITGNTCIRGAGTTSDYTSEQYTIYVNDSTSRNNLITSNNIMGKNYVNSGTNNTFSNNKYN